MYGDPAASVGEGATIVLSGIGTAMTEDMLTNLYRTYGPISRVRHNGSNSAQVVFAQKAHALKAVKATNGAVVHGKTLKVSLQRVFKKTTEPCRGFVAGICRKGDMCKYYHVTDNAAFAAPAPPVVAKAPREPKVKDPKLTERTVVPPEIQAIPDTKVCRHFSRGYCAQGEQCKFAHVFGLPNRAGPAPIGKVARSCLFFQSGVCARGDACRYVHEPIAGAAPAPKAVAQSSNSDNESEAKVEPEQKDENRTCVECEKPGVAMWKCAKCDNSLYCDECNLTVHRARVMAKHKRSHLPSLPKLPRCGECESKTASVRCEQCEVLFCASCNVSVHKFKSLRKHVRVKLSGRINKAQPNAKKPKQELITAKEKEVHILKSVPQAKVNDPVLYVESVPQLEFSSDSVSESEDEEMEREVSPNQSNGDEPMAAAGPSEAESDEEFDDVKLTPLAPAILAPVVKVQTSHSSDSESGDDFDDKPAAKSAISSAPVPKMELSSNSESSDKKISKPAQDPASTSKKAASSESENDSEVEAPAAKSAQTRKPTLSVTSSKFESDDDSEASSIHVVKQAKKPTQKTKMPSGSSNGFKHEAPSKPVAKKTAPYALKSVEKEAALADSSRIDLSDSSEDEAPPLQSRTPAPLRALARARNNTAGGISVGSSHTLVKKIEAYNESSEAADLHLDSNLNGFERLLAHDCAERFGLAHKSIGSGVERHIVVSRHGAKRPAAVSGKGRKSKKSKH